jgi:hypothetical protein
MSASAGPRHSASPRAQELRGLLEATVRQSVAPLPDRVLEAGSVELLVWNVQQIARPTGHEQATGRGRIATQLEQLAHV